MVGRRTKTPGPGDQPQNSSRANVIHGCLNLPPTLDQSDREIPASSPARAAKAGMKGLGRRRFVAEGSVRPDDDPGLDKRVEDPSIEQFVAKPGVEAHNEAVSQGLPRLNVGRPGPDSSDPVLHGLGEEFRSVPDRMCSGTPRRMN